MPNFNVTKTSGFSSEPKRTTVNVDALKILVEEDPQTVEEIRKLLLKKGTADITKVDKVFGTKPSATANPTPAPNAPAPAVPAPAQTEEPETNFEIDTKLQILISSIPIANPGNLITSEYHNALRDAVRALASRIGLTVNPTAEFRILTFAPDFLPMKSKKPDILHLNWQVTLERAAIPSLIENEDFLKTVAGGFVVQLPDAAAIYQMIVRGARGAAAPNPREFNVSLMRKRLDKNEPPQTLVSINLKDVKEGPFEDKESVQLSDSELSLLDEDEGATGTTVSKRKVVNNEKWLYFVTAEFLAADNTAAEKYEINSIQILCIN